eukprot:m.117353 g.117353  ORF g.117353 m.117353 type:complete len:282 (+) comp16397_c0_seq4:433-1278(+)
MHFPGGHQQHPHVHHNRYAQFDGGPDHTPGFWSHTATIDWCERNYQVTWYVAEFWNCVSSLVIAMAGLINLYTVYKQRLDTRLAALSLAIIAIGVGSALFHGTLTFHFQLADELPMVWAMLVWLFSWVELRHETPKYPLLPVGLVLYFIMWSLIHAWAGFTTIFQVHFGLLVVVGFYFVYDWRRRYFQDAMMRWLTMVYAVPFVVGFALWLFERTHCLHIEPTLGFNPELHAWWHVLSAVSCYHSVVLLGVARHRALGKPARCGQLLGGLLPYAVAPTKQL